VPGKVSIIIPAYNSEKSIGKVLGALEGQKYKPFEVIVVNDFSRDNTSDVVKKFKGVKLIENRTNLGLSKSINKGIRASSGSIIITLHDDCVPLSDTWISCLVNTFSRDPKIGVVSSNYVIDFDKLSLKDKCFSYAYWLGDDKKLAKNEGIEEVNVMGDKCDAYRFDVLKKIGFFDEKFKFASEDSDISCKVCKSGYTIAKNYACKVEHIFSESEREVTLLDHFKKAIQTTENHIYVLMRHGLNYKIDAALSLLSFVLGYFVPASLPFLYAFSIPLHKFFGIFGVLSLIAIRIAKPELLANQLLGLILGVTYLLAKNAVKSLRYVRSYKKIDLVIPIIAFCFVWDLAAGIGWTIGVFKFIGRELNATGRIRYS
jgi:glycosyltransferase involved in cell wall biosynthesis